MSALLNDPPLNGQPVRIVAMDVDNTLLRGQSQAHFARTLHQHKLLPLSKRLLVYWWYLKHRLGWRPANPTYFQNAILGSMAGLPQRRLDSAFRACATEMLQPRLRLDAVAAIRAWRADGAKVILVSASLEPLICHLVEMVSADGAIATKIVDSGALFSGAIDGHMVIGELKWERLKAHADALFADWRLEAAYGDDDGDLALLTRAAKPITVNPLKTMLALATEKKWEIVTWSDPPRN
jgi:HAD superfamily hydrolase (TIGR01490 family)